MQCSKFSRDLQHLLMNCKHSREKPLKLWHRCWVIKLSWRNYCFDQYRLNSDLKAPELYHMTFFNIFLNSHFFHILVSVLAILIFFLTLSVWHESYLLCFTHSWLKQYVFQIDVSVHYFGNKIHCYFSKKLQKLQTN